MILNSAKNITTSSWDTIKISDTVIACINKLSYNELYQFIFTDRRGHTIVDIRGHTIGYIKITGVDRDAADSN